MDDPEFSTGMKFRSFDQFKEAVRNFGIKHRYVMKFRPNDKKRCKAYCKKGCPFKIWASKMNKDNLTVQIKSAVLKHECSRDHNIRHVNPKWIAQKYIEQFRADPNWCLSGIIQAVKSNQKASIGRVCALRAKHIALLKLNGDEAEQMKMLNDYRLELVRTHPNSTVLFKRSLGVFKGMYVCLAPLRDGFMAGCRRVISIDGCWLKGLYGGQLLAAVGIDANDCTYPVAWCVVDSETKENWMWFLSLLADDLPINNSYGWCFMSDRQKGLIPAIETLFPHAEHRFCVRHILCNFRKSYKGKALKDLLWACARAPYSQGFDKCMEAVGDISKGAKAYLKRITQGKWTRSTFDTRFKCDMLLNNLCESFNHVILEAKTKGIIIMNEMIRTKLMVRIQKKRDAMRRLDSVFCPKPLKKLERGRQMSWFYKAVWSGGKTYQVFGFDGQFVVDKGEFTCSCRRWQLTGIPCHHAIAAMNENNEDPQKFMDDCYRISTYLDTYSHLLNPTNGKELWPKSNDPPVIPPPHQSISEGAENSC
ncbi:uncharacterized protein LOC126667453 [Mercurialis annua]|uniref:uncharacterized protein LOC126667453 n=1 Tax=Mercurialis annua TaxID=3986 RepID=UPI00215FBB3A|nr:uncharacterized protein LOC126667453 [Mercurialis annua]